MKAKDQKILFIINPNYANEIQIYFKSLPTEFEIYELTKNCSIKNIKSIINECKADRVIAVGGDGTLKLVAESLLETDIPIGIIPAGSANGMAKELGIPEDLNEALALAISGKTKKIHAVLVNNELCIHLADIGFNAYIVKKFDELATRGMLTYAKAAWHAFWYHRKMDIEFKIGHKIIKEKENGKLILITSHLLSELEDLITEIIFMQEGQVLFHKKIAQLQQETNEQKISKAIAQILKNNKK